MRSIADVLRYVPGAVISQGEGHRDQIILRGNNSTADFFVDGLRDDVQYYRGLYNAERIEVLKGPNAMIFGRGGGVTLLVADHDGGGGLSLGDGDGEELVDEGGLPGGLIEAHGVGETGDQSTSVGHQGLEAGILGDLGDVLLHGLGEHLFTSLGGHEFVLDGTLTGGLVHFWTRWN